MAELRRAHPPHRVNEGFLLVCDNLYNFGHLIVEVLRCRLFQPRSGICVNLFRKLFFIVTARNHKKGLVIRGRLPETDLCRLELLPLLAAVARVR